MGSSHSNAHTHVHVRRHACALSLSHTHTNTLVCTLIHKNGQVLAATMFATIFLTTVLLAEILYIQT